MVLFRLTRFDSDGTLCRTRPQSALLSFLMARGTPRLTIQTFGDLCAPIGNDGVAQVSRYDIGVNGVRGGMFGKGVGDNIIKTYEWLVGQYNPGDQLFIFGFSRGAFNSPELGGVYRQIGLLKPGAPLGVKQLYDRYRRADDKTIWRLTAEHEAGELSGVSLEERWMLRYSMPVQIKLVGVWDTVGALGVPWFSLEGISRSSFGWMHTGLRVPIQHGFHALAIDEHRRSFAPTLWTVLASTLAQPRPLSSVEQRWFPGNHGNVGGGYSGDLLVQAPLRWLKGKAEELGLSFRYDVELDSETHAADIPDSYADFMRGAYRFASKRHYRIIGAESYKDERGVHSTVNETIDGSVFECWRDNSKYRPASLTEWASRYQVDPTDIKGAVLSHSPNTSAGG